MIIVSPCYHNRACFFFMSMLDEFSKINDKAAIAIVAETVLLYLSQAGHLSAYVGCSKVAAIASTVSRRLFIFPSHFLPPSVV